METALSLKRSSSGHLGTMRGASGSAFERWSVGWSVRCASGQCICKMFCEMCFWAIHLQDVL